MIFKVMQEHTQLRRVLAVFRKPDIHNLIILVDNPHEHQTTFWKCLSLGHRNCVRFMKIILVEVRCTVL